jgi:hypothetical protein
MNVRLKTRLRKLEQHYEASGLTEEKVQERLERAILTTLSDPELRALVQYYAWSDDERPTAASAEQKAGWETYERRCLELRTTGKLVVNGCEVLRFHSVDARRGSALDSGARRSS